MKVVSNYDHWMDDDYDEFLDRKETQVRRMKKIDASVSDSKKKKIQKKSSKRKIAEAFNNDMDF